MLPAQLSDDLCSLQENQPRFALAMDVIIDRDGRVVTEIAPQYTNAVIRVKKNFVYEESTLFKNKHYQELLEKTKQIDTKIENSHDVVSHWMIFMNSKCGESMFKQKTGIYRSVFSKVVSQEPSQDITINPETKRFLNHWNSVSGQYVFFSETTRIDHELMNIPCYVHITSPIRRLVDLLNQMLFFSHFSLVNSLSVSAKNFLQGWLIEIEFINERMKSTLKVERECEIIRKCLSDPTILEKIHDAYVIDIRELVVDNREIQYKYLIYLEKERIILSMKSEQKKNIYNKYQVKLYKIEVYGIASKIKVGFF